MKEREAAHRAASLAVLTRILKLVVPEYKEEPLDAIEGYIHDGIRVGVVALDANTKDVESHAVGHRILPLAQESNDMKNGRVTFDIVFTVDLPKDKARKNQLYIFVNIEQQLNFCPDYPISSRTVYYLSRQISSQKNTVFTGENYGEIKKCYSIWICPDIARERKSFISLMDFSMTNLYGKCRFHRSSYDKMAGIFCSFQPGEEGNKLLKFLDTLFSQEKSLEERKRVLKEEYDIQDDEVEGTIRKMCNLSEGIYNSGYNSGYDSGVEEGRIQEAITIYHGEMSLSPTEIIDRVMKKYNLEKKVATKYVEETLHLVAM